MLLPVLNLRDKEVALLGTEMPRVQLDWTWSPRVFRILFPNLRKSCCVLLHFLPDSSDHKTTWFDSAPLVFWDSITNGYFHRVCQQRRTGSPFQNWEVQQKLSMIQSRQTTFSPFDKPYHIVNRKVSENQTVVSGCQSPPQIKPRTSPVGCSPSFPISCTRSPLGTSSLTGDLYGLLSQGLAPPRTLPCIIPTFQFTSAGMHEANAFYETEIAHSKG